MPQASNMRMISHRLTNRGKDNHVLLSLAHLAQGKYPESSILLPLQKCVKTNDFKYL